MPVLQTPYASPHCNLTEWSIDAARYTAFVEALAYLYLRQEQNALRVINALDPKSRPRHGNAANNALKKLAGPNPEDVELAASGTDEERQAAKNRIDNHIAQRDGLLFQHVSWIAARIALPEALLSEPHVRKADKGFDGFIVDFDQSSREVRCIILCEDKASEDPRPLVRDSVWREVRGIMSRERDDQILADLTTLLSRIRSLDEEAVEDAIDRVIWKDVCHFRVSIATGTNRRNPKTGFSDLLKGFEDAAPGHKETRIGGVMSFEDVRAGLADLASAVSVKVRKIYEERPDV